MQERNKGREEKKGKAKKEKMYIFAKIGA